MKRLVILFTLFLFASCSSTQQMISETPTSTRQAIVYEDKVVIVTKTTITKEHYERLVAARVQNTDLVNK